MMALFQRAVVGFYCMDMADIVLLGIPLTAAFAVFVDRFRDRRWLKPLLGVLFVVFLGIVIHLTVANRSNDRVVEVNLIPFHTYRDVMNGGHRDTYRNNFMNVALFYPAGLLGVSLLPRRWPGWCKVLLVTAVFCLMSGGIEYVQYRFALGLVEIDDVIHNTLGALLGALAVVLLAKPAQLVNRKPAEGTNPEEIR